jgi:hypothetical protein
MCSQMIAHVAAITYCIQEVREAVKSGVELAREGDKGPCGAMEKKK